MKKRVAFGLGILLLAGVLTSCSSAKTAEKGVIKLGCVNWDDSISITNLAAVVLEDKMGYRVEVTMADVAPIFTSIASGNTDAYLDTWLPTTQKDYIDKYGDKMIDLGVLNDGASIGLAVPSYVPVDSIDELNAHKELFNGEIVGIDAGAGQMQITANVIKEYGLDFTLLTGSGPAMTASLQKAIEAEKNIIVTAWKPHWKFSRWDLKMLKDPKGEFGTEEQIHKMARLGFDKDMPEATEFLRHFKLTDQELSSLMHAVEEDGGDAKEAARKWAAEHKELVQSWLP